MLARERDCGTCVPIPVAIGLQEVDRLVWFTIVIEYVLGHHHAVAVVTTEVVAVGRGILYLRVQGNPSIALNIEIHPHMNSSAEFQAKDVARGNVLIAKQVDHHCGEVATFATAFLQYLLQRAEVAFDVSEVRSYIFVALAGIVHHIARFVPQFVAYGFNRRVRYVYVFTSVAQMSAIDFAVGIIGLGVHLREVHPHALGCYVESGLQGQCSPRKTVCIVHQCLVSIVGIVLYGSLRITEVLHRLVFVGLWNGHVAHKLAHVSRSRLRIDNFIGEAVGLRCLLGRWFTVLQRHVVIIAASPGTQDDGQQTHSKKNPLHR